MNESLTSTNSVANWFGSITRTTRILLTIAMIAIVLIVIQVSGWQSRTVMCELLGQCPLRDHELQRIQVTLGQSGLDQFQLEEGKLLVPVAKRAAYLKALAAGNALPEHLQKSKQESSSLNPFLSRNQQELIERAEKKRQVRDLISRLPFVAEAWFEMDEVKSRSAFAPSRQTAVVSIQPSGGRELTPMEIKTVRQVIGGALAGIESENIVVTDLTAGRAFQAGDVGSNQDSRLQQATFQAQTQDRKSFYRREIEQALNSYRDIDIDIQYRATAQQDSGKRFASLPTFVEPKLSPKSKPAMAVGTNGQASVDDLEIEQTQPATAEMSMATTMRSGVTERVSVTVMVPQTLVEQTFGMKKAKSVLGIPLEKTRTDELDANFEKLKSEMVRKIRPLLPLASFENASGYPISILLNRDETAAADWKKALAQLVNDNWPTLAVLLIGLFMLMIVTKPSGHDREKVSPALVLDSEVAESSENPEDLQKQAQAKQELTRLIDQDPDAAAEVIKSWIRKAA